MLAEGWSKTRTWQYLKQCLSAKSASRIPDSRPPGDTDIGSTSRLKFVPCKRFGNAAIEIHERAPPKALPPLLIHRLPYTSRDIPEKICARPCAPLVLFFLRSRHRNRSPLGPPLLQNPKLKTHVLPHIIIHETVSRIRHPIVLL